MEMKRKEKNCTVPEILEAWKTLTVRRYRRKVRKVEDEETGSVSSFPNFSSRDTPNKVAQEG